MFGECNNEIFTIWYISCGAQEIDMAEDCENHQYVGTSDS